MVRDRNGCSPFADIYCYGCSGHNYSSMNKGRMEFVNQVDPDRNQGFYLHYQCKYCDYETNYKPDYVLKYWIH